MSSIFVFGSNLAGRHGKGAAETAHKLYGAKYGIGKGLTGDSYAIPTKNEDLVPLTLDEIEDHIKTFVKFTKKYPFKKFLLTRVGCGLSGNKDSDIAPLFTGIDMNVKISSKWLEWFPYHTTWTDE